jgi:AcrR family transcriptional regulator
VTVVNGTGQGKGAQTPMPRDDQKAENRARIAARAMELFADRGFEHVSVAEVAAAAGVTEKTVFNHFRTKEDLVYSDDQGFEVALLDAVRARPPGESFFEAVRTFLLETYSRGLLRQPDVRRRARTLATLVSASPTLRVREREILNRYADVLRDQLAAELASEPGDLRPAVAAGATIAIHQAVIAGYRQGLLGREAVAALERRIVGRRDRRLRPHRSTRHWSRRGTRE